MKTAVVILNWNTKEYLRRWLPALLESCKGIDAGVVVADSASTDGSLEMVGEIFPQVKCIPLDENYGFTGGYNRALAQVDAEYFVLLNSDIEVPAGWLAPLVEWMDAHPRCGICGPKLHGLVREGNEFIRKDSFEYAGAAGGYIDRFGYPFCRGRVLKRLEQDNGQYDSARDVMWVSGACLMIRSSLWKQLGGLDDRFFAHMEEIDMCWRAQLAGYRVTVVPQSTVWHLGGGTLSPDSPFKLQLNYRNNLLMLGNNLPATVGKCRASARILFRMCLDGGSALVYLLGGKKEYFKAVVTAHRQYRKLRGSYHSSYHGDNKPKGYFGGLCILPLAAFKGKGIFDYLKEYENHN